jgi:hypothetical protein
MVTREQAMEAQRFEHARIKNADGTPLRARRNGSTRLWKRSPLRFEVPVKIGLYGYDYVTDGNARDWNVA